MHTENYFKEKLEALKKDISQRIEAIDKDIRHEGMSADWTEQAVERENDEVLESLGNASEEELLKINTALKRLNAGDYFTCQKCGELIPESRLELLPFTTYCVGCSEEMES